jgi:hypothetical protein
MYYNYVKILSVPFGYVCEFHLYFYVLVELLYIIRWYE